MLFWFLFQIGYSDGICEGQESISQAGFDIGYAEGFRNAFTVGRYQGLTSAEKFKKALTATDNETQLDLLLMKPTRGQCQICQDNSLINENIENILAVQKKHAKAVAEALHRKYGHLTP